jgi:hypothetical protein
MAYIEGEQRGQHTLFPTTLDELIPQDHVCRVIEAFVGRLDMAKLGFVRSEPAETGRPGYDPQAPIVATRFVSSTPPTHMSRATVTTAKMPAVAASFPSDLNPSRFLIEKARGVIERVKSTWIKALNVKRVVDADRSSLPGHAVV